ncbi:MAG TPA: N-acetyltransferase [Terracidiphilus sp.]
MLYRPYEAKDFAALYALEEACFDHPFRFSAGYLRQLLTHPRAAAWIAEEDGILAGFAIVRRGDEGPEGTTAYIETIEVAPNKRGHGVGGELMRRMEGSAQKTGATLLWLHVDEENVAASRLYEAHGYTREGRKEGFYPQGRAALVYAKRLNTR